MTTLPLVKSLRLVTTLRKAALALTVAAMAAGPAWAGKYASIVVDLDSARVLHAREADEPRYPASLTKVMTLYMVFDALDAGTLKLSERMPVSKRAAAAQPSKLGLKSGATIKVEDAIRALVTKSANDVAIVFAEELAGSESKFALKMTAKAKELGLTDTTFRNASGLPDSRQLTTARDMAKLAEAIYVDHKDRYNYFSVPQFVWAKRRHINHNTLLKTVRGVDGIKTGFTNASGYNLMASAERDGRRVIAVMLGGTTGKSRDLHVRDLLEAAFIEIGVSPDLESDPRGKVAFGDYRELSADDLAAAQLKRFSDADSGLVASVEANALAETAQTGSTEEEGFDEEVAEGDADPVDAIGALITGSTDAIGGLIAERAPLAATVASETASSFVDGAAALSSAAGVEPQAAQ
jgi:D-alanyl-D-alanine carboxypeptidase